MRVLLWILLIFALAVGFTLAGKFDPGYAVLVYPPYRIEMSLTLLVVLFLALVVLGDMFARIADVTLHLPKKVRTYRQQQRQQQGQAALLAAMEHYLAQRYREAETSAQRAIALEVSPELAASIAARAAEALQAHTPAVTKK
ncbi:heme biosynthesis HemY N-terminal domain-containing protein [Sulfuriferula thiophila]|uniref:heme biosynthesis HemY N-terminal domain-containing protein n=1 Tax=Sulfuriferula thiophila TaxID=1781211 RepID=UPI000F614964|nr:heme biosynthesis HemY N-terminal domain-containing protein [Sulfuriferula thiophila]